MRDNHHARRDRLHRRTLRLVSRLAVTVLPVAARVMVVGVHMTGTVSPSSSFAHWHGHHERVGCGHRAGESEGVGRAGRVEVSGVYSDTVSE